MSSLQLMDFKMEEVDETTLAETYKLLEVGPHSFHGGTYQRDGGTLQSS